MDPGKKRLTVPGATMPRPRFRGIGGHPKDGLRTTSMSESNAIAVLCMLGYRSPSSPKTPWRGCLRPTKGSITNLIQCTHALGRAHRGIPPSRLRCGDQQIIHDSRLPQTDFGRVFPHDRKEQPNIVSQGLLYRESFIEGLSPQAFFIHAIAFAV